MAAPRRGKGYDQADPGLSTRTPLTLRMLTARQAGPDHVYAAIEGPLARLGPLQRAGHTLLPPGPRVQALLVHLRRQVRFPGQYYTIQH